MAATSMSAGTDRLQRPFCRSYSGVVRCAPGSPDLGPELAAAGNGKTGGARPCPHFGGSGLSRARRLGELGRNGRGGHIGEPLGRGGLGVGPRTGGGQEPVGPFLGEMAGLAENDRDVGPANLQFGEPIGDQGGPDGSSLNTWE
jgi:hypothetical protein